jgi:beta-lactamase class D
MEVSEDRDIFIEITKETMQHFINRLGLINTDLAVDLATVWEDETKYD